MSNPSAEVKEGSRFAFGRNWSRFLEHLDDEKIRQAENSLKEMLEVSDLNGQRFLDIGSGSGLFSLAAKRLGASVHSFDYDPESVACTHELRRRYFADGQDWLVEQGSVLDSDYLRSLGAFDIVYSWGVLHHTGAMWAALRNLDINVKEGSKLFISLYNRQPFMSAYWSFVKRTYNRLPVSRPIFVLIHLLYPTLPSLLVRWFGGRIPPRGMMVWFDLLDWLGGYPFEVSTPEQVFDFFRSRDYTLERMRTVGGQLGCNEYVLTKSPATEALAQTQRP